MGTFLFVCALFCSLSHTLLGTVKMIVVIDAAKVLLTQKILNDILHYSLCHDTLYFYLRFFLTCFLPLLYQHLIGARLDLPAREVSDDVPLNPPEGKLL